MINQEFSVFLARKGIDYPHPYGRSLLFSAASIAAWSDNPEADVLMKLGQHNIIAAAFAEWKSDNITLDVVSAQGEKS